MTDSHTEPQQAAEEQYGQQTVTNELIAAAKDSNDAMRELPKKCNCLICQTIRIADEKIAEQREAAINPATT